MKTIKSIMLAFVLCALAVLGGGGYSMSTMGNNLFAAYWQQRHIMPTDGLVFYASLNGQTPNQAETGQTLTTTGSIAYGIYHGVPCTTGWSNTAYITFSDAAMPSGSASRTISFWVKGRGVLGYGTVSSTKALYMYCIEDNGSGEIGFNTSGNNVTFAGKSFPNVMNHICITLEGKTVRLFINGIFIEEKVLGQLPNTNLNNAGKIGRYGTNNDYYHGYVAGCRIYNKVLTDAEIQLLAHEFTPTA